MAQVPLSLDTDRLLDGPLSRQNGENPFSAVDWGGQGGEGGPAEPRELDEHGQVLASLGLIYLRHGDPARTMVLGLAAMSMGDVSPPTLLMVAESMLQAGDPEQAMTVLSRFDNPDLLGRAPTGAERAARHYIAARILHRRGENEAARAELARARQVSDTEDAT